MALAAVCFCLSFLIIEVTSCGGKDLAAISQTLAEVDDWEGLAIRLDIKTGVIQTIRSTCIRETLCLRRELVVAYCELQDTTQIELVPWKISKTLDAMGKKRQGDMIRRYYPEIAEIDSVIEEEIECTENEGVCTAELQTKLTLAGKKWLLTLFSEQCNHKRDYLRLLLILSVPLCMLSYYYYTDDEIDGSKSLLIRILFFSSSLFLPFFVYSLVFYYHLTGPPCYCFRPAISFIGLILFICALVGPIILFVYVCVGEDECSYCKCPPYTMSVVALLLYFSFYWITNDYFC